MFGVAAMSTKKNKKILCIDCGIYFKTRSRVIVCPSCETIAWTHYEKTKNNFDESAQLTYYFKGDNMLKFNSDLIDWIAFATKIYASVQKIIADKKFNYKDKDNTKSIINDFVVAMAKELNWSIKLTTIRIAEAMIIIEEIFYHLPQPEPIQEE